jgi:hypothetical protein
MKITKKAIVSFAGSAALALAVTLVPLSGTALAAADKVTGGVQGGIDGAKPTDSNVPTQLFGPGSIFTTVVNVLLFVIGAISVIMLIIGGIRYTISAGDSGAVTAAKNTIMYAIIGLVIAFLAFAIVNWVLGQLIS